MPQDLLIESVLFHGSVRNIGIADGVIISLDADPSANKVINAEGLELWPGVIDCHVHFNEPGRTHWEGLASGSSAFAALLRQK